MVEDREDAASVPEEGLCWEVVHADGVAKLDVRDGFGERKVGAEEGDEDVAPRPVFDV